MARSMKVLIPLPANDFDPTEAAVPWQYLKDAGHEIVFATPDGRPAQGDLKMLTGRGLGAWKSLLMADRRALEAYSAMQRSPEFNSPVKWSALDSSDYGSLLLPGGHAPGMRDYLESPVLQKLASDMLDRKPVGAICHGVLVASRARASDGKSALHRKKTTCLLKSQELAAWVLTSSWLGNYYRTYPETVEDEVRGALEKAEQFARGPVPLRRDSPKHLERGFAVTDGLYVSARWPGDAHLFARRFADLIGPGTESRR
jgi:protease I